MDYGVSPKPNSKGLSEYLLVQLDQCHSGIPQGYVLGPVLFTIYMNESPGLIDSKMNMYAGDTELYREEVSQGDVDILKAESSQLDRGLATAHKCKIMWYQEPKEEILYETAKRGVQSARRN